MTAPVTLVIPTFNRADLIGETLDSAFAQTTPFAEIIVVDDGSTDDTPEVLKAYGNKIRVIRTENQGVQQARNTGVVASKTELVALSDSDDILDPTFVETVATWMENQTKVDIVYCNFIIFDSQKKYPDKFSLAPVGFFDDAEKDGDFFTSIPELYLHLIYYQPLFPTGSVFRRSFYQRIGGYNVSMRGIVGEDQEFARRSIALGDVALCSRVMSHIRKHEKNQSGDCLRMNIGDATILEYCLAHHPGADRYREQMLASVDQRRFAAFDAAFARGDFALAQSIVKQLGKMPSGIKFRLKLAILGSPPNIRRLAWRFTQT